MSAPDPDETAIRELIRAQAKRLSWTRDTPADWNGFKGGCLPNALLIASARPARTQTVDEFLARMQALSTGSLQSFAETALNGAVHVFGNVAVAIIAGETLENESERNRDVSGYLLVKEAGHWKIVAQAWDKETAARPIPPAMTAAP